MMRMRKGFRSWWKNCLWEVSVLFGVESLGCGFFKLGSLGNVEIKGDLGVKFIFLNIWVKIL